MLIEIEGIAHAGKSTLVEALRKEGFVKDTLKLHHTCNTVTTYNEILIPRAADSWVHVTDRGHGSEWVYSNLWNRREPWTAHQFWQLDMTLGKEGTRVVYLSQPHDILIQRYMDTGRKPEGDLDEIEALWEQFLLDTSCKVLRVDYRFTLDEIVKSLKRYVMEDE